MTAAVIFTVLVPLLMGIGFICLAVNGIKSLGKPKQKEPKKMLVRDEDGNFKTYVIDKFI